MTVQPWEPPPSEPRDPMDEVMYSARSGVQMRHPWTHAPIYTYREYAEAHALDRKVASTDLSWDTGKIWVSTVHLITDLSFGMMGEESIYWETMIFGDIDAITAVDVDEFQFRHSSEEGAVLVHRALVRGIISELVERGFAVTTYDRPVPEPVAARIATYQGLELER